MYFQLIGFVQGLFIFVASFWLAFVVKIALLCVLAFTLCSTGFRGASRANDF
ncbi:unnamed protein product [Arabidopsis halleri]